MGGISVLSVAEQPACFRIGRRHVDVTHPGKAMFGPGGPTKGDLARYYEQVAPALLRHARGRPLALESYPGGIAAPGFFMKSAPRHFPDWIERAEVGKRGGSLTQVLARDAATLVYLAGQNIVALHVWLSQADRPHQPDRVIIDLDPADGVPFAEIRAAAREAGARLRDAGLAPFAMVTGSRGIHVVCPIRRGPDYQAAHGFARGVAEAMVQSDPERLTLTWKRSERGRRIYLDVNRNAYAQHVTAAYGVRARAGAPVAMPIAWDELDDRRLAPDRWTIATAPGRLSAEGDAWRDLSRHARALPRR
ncbi:MAG TPA: non-homologous end-joining DNA ligase [Solirubrobacteraceae bacterium]|jgi:bifunctional non-homologous end joining protein LigD|nr:non-homologous end-joining DNA ligase [Solirubrobacteraceae bacterium]